MSNLNYFSDDELRRELARREKKTYNPFSEQNPIGLWKVETEGDCEGRTIKQLGFYSGHVADIAKHLASKSYYKLTFRRIEPIEIRQVDNDIEYVHIGMDINTGTWDQSGDERVESFKMMLNNRAAENNFSVERSTYFAGVKLVFGRKR